MKSAINNQQERDFILSKSLAVNTKAKRHLDLDHEHLLTPNTLYQMAFGLIPDLWETCHELYETFNQNEAPYSALQFVRVLKKLESLDQLQLEKFIQNPTTNHVLIQNKFLKVVLIHWPSGKLSNIHGHPEGGCVFKVLHGSLEEMRYTTEASPQLLAVSRYQKGGMGYIDDKMGYHAGGNPTGAPAISIHAYTPGLKQS